MEPAVTPRPAKVELLAYAPASPFHQRRWWRRTVVIAALLITAGAAWRWGPEMWSAARMLYAQRQCLAYAPPADEVVYEAEPAAAARLASRPGFRLVTVPAYGGSGPTAVAAARTPDCWTDFLRAATGAPPVPVPSGATVFLHERRTLDGRRVLVHVSFATDASGVALFILGYDATVTVFEPGTWSTPPREGGSGYAIDVMSGPPRVPCHARVFAGQADAADPTRFTIRYQMWGREDVVDGRVGKDGYVTLTRRRPPEGGE